MTADEDSKAERKAGRKAGRQASFGATMRAVFWSFFGVRKRRDYEHDAANLNPVHVIIGAVLGVVVFIGILIMLVRFAVAHG